MRKPKNSLAAFLYTWIQKKPADVILNVIEQFEPDLLVVGSVARQRLAGLLIGNTAEQVLRSVDCSVLTIKPAGFESPIID